MTENYEVETRSAYRSRKRAVAYKKDMEGLKWARFTMWREIRSVEKALERFTPGEDDRVLDAPCGTGIAGTVLSRFPAGIVALDISRDMMDLASRSYAREKLQGFVQADITRIPLCDGALAGAVVLGFMHRVPLWVQEEMLEEMTRVTSRFLVVSFAVDNLARESKDGLSASSAPATRALRRQ